MVCKFATHVMHMKINGPCSICMKKGLNTFAKSIGVVQAVQSDLGRNILLVVRFPLVSGPYYIIILLAVKSESGNRRGGLVVRASASRAGGRGFDSWLRQTKVFKTGGSGFPPWRSGLWE